jgi:23S rRNA (uracil1939-C5)-methyltransferase
MSEYEVRIEKIVAGGDGLARHEGRVVFVPGVAPGDRVRARAVREKTDYLRALATEILEPGPGRRAPPCPYYESCGGCRLMHLRPEVQLEAKERILREGLERSTRSAQQMPIAVHTASELHYRNRLRFHVSFVGGRAIAGFRRRESREIVDIDRCLLGTSTLNAVWQRLRQVLPGDRRLTRSLLAVELEESTHEPGRIAARFLVSSTDGLRAFDEGRRQELTTELGLEGLVAAVDDTRGGGPGVRAGRPYVEHRVSDFTLRQSVGSFFQSNRFLLEDLVSTVTGGAPSARGVDLFCGVGLFALPLSRQCGSVVGVESHGLALKDARENAERAGAEGRESGRKLRFVRADATEYALRAKFSPSDLVIVDPPRGGLSKGLIDALGKSPLHSFRYVSCDPPALFRDAVRLSAHGLRVDNLALFDLFPNTQHFETVAVFSRGT